jgi:hypothetical protein
LYNTFTPTVFLGFLCPLLFWNGEQRHGIRMCCWYPEVRLREELGLLANISSFSVWGTEFQAHIKRNLLLCEWLFYFNLYTLTRRLQ